MIKRELSIFLVVGTLTVLIDFCTYSLLLWMVGVHIAIAKSTGFITGTVFAYVANKIWTFRNSQAEGSIPRFMLLYASTLGINVSINAAVLYLTHGSQAAFGAAFVIATGISAFLNFLGMKFFVFKISVQPNSLLIPQQKH